MSFTDPTQIYDLADIDHLRVEAFATGQRPRRFTPEPPFNTSLDARQVERLKSLVINAPWSRSVDPDATSGTPPHKLVFLSTGGTIYEGVWIRCDGLGNELARKYVSQGYTRADCSSDHASSVIHTTFEPYGEMHIVLNNKALERATSMWMSFDQAQTIGYLVNEDNEAFSFESRKDYALGILDPKSGEWQRSFLLTVADSFGEGGDWGFQLVELVPTDAPNIFVKKVLVNCTSTKTSVTIDLFYRDAAPQDGLIENATAEKSTKIVLEDAETALIHYATLCLLEKRYCSHEAGDACYLCGTL